MTGLRQLQFMKELMKLCVPGETLMVSGEWKGNPTMPRAHDEWPWERSPCSFRSLLQREVLFDIDEHTWDQVVLNQQLITQRLDTVGCPYYEYNSAGKGWHIHVFLDADNVEDVTSWSQIRLRFWEWATTQGGHADKVKAVWRTFSVVRAEGAPRRTRSRTVEDLFRRHMTYKSYQERIPPSRPAQSHVTYPGPLVPFKLPTPFLLTLINENGLKDCPRCDLRISERTVSYDTWDDKVESVTCCICFARQLRAVAQSLDGEWRYAVPAWHLGLPGYQPR